MKINKLLNVILPILTVVAIIVLWSVLSVTTQSEYLLPSVSKTAEALVSLLGDGEFYISLLNTLLRSLIGFAFSFASAFSLSVLSVKFKLAERVISTVISVVRALPTIAVVLLLLIWTNSLIAPVVVTTLVVMPTLYTQIFGALQGLDKQYAEASRVDGANELQVFFHIELPLVSSTVYQAIGSGISLNFKLMVAAEVLAQTAYSLGYMLNISKIYYQTATMFALVVVAVLIGVVVEAVFNRLSLLALKKQN